MDDRIARRAAGVAAPSITVGPTNSSVSPRAYAASIAAAAAAARCERLGVDDRVVAALDALPAPVAVHREVAAADRRDRGARVGGRQPRLEVGDEAEPPTTAACRGRRAARGSRRSATPSRAASSTRATRWRSLAWTPPGPMRLTTWRTRRRAGSLARREEGGPRDERAVGDRRVDPRAGPGAPADRRRGSGGRPRSCPSGRAAARPPPPMPGARCAASARAGRARSASARRRSRRRRPPSRSRTRRARRGRWVGAGSRPAGDRRSPAGSAGQAAGRAVIPARATIPAISSGLSDAPPTSAPSIDGSARNSPMFAEVTLPPYRTGHRVGRRRPSPGRRGSPGSRRPSRRRRRRWRCGRCRSPRPARRR